MKPSIRSNTIATQPAWKTNALCMAAIFALSAASVSAQSLDTWNGNTDANWSTTGNWAFSSGSGPVANGDSLIFGAAGSSGTSLNNNLSSLSLNNFTINSGASAFTFGGNALTLTGGLTNNAAANESIALPLGGSGGLTQAGSGTLVLGGTNTYSGNTTISSGVLQLSSLGIVPVLYLSFDNVSGTTVVNGGSGGTAMNGVLNGGANAAIVSGGKFGNCLQISGSSASSASCRVASSVVPLNVGAGNHWTVAMWIKTSTAGACYAYQGDGGWAGTYPTIGNTCFYLGDGADHAGSKAGGVRWGQAFEAGTATVNDGQWHHVVFECNGTTKASYVDGNVDTLTVDNWSAGGSGGQFWIGGAGDTGDGTANLNGDIDDVCVYNQALTQAQIQTLMTGYTPSPLPQLSPASTVSVASGAKLDLNGFSSTIAGLNGSGTVDSTLASALPVLTISNNTSSSFSGAITNSAGTLTLVKTGSGTQTLAGANSYGGSTTISAGQLTFSANNSLAGVLSVNNGALALTGGTLTLANGSNPNFFVGSAGGTGVVTLSGTAALKSTVANTFLRLGGNSSGGGGIGIINNSSANSAVTIGSYGVGFGQGFANGSGAIYNNGFFTNSAGGLYLGNNDNSYGYIYNSGTFRASGSFDLSANGTTMGNGANAVVDVVGGTVIVDNANNFMLNVGPVNYGGSTAGAQLNVSGGQLQLNTLGATVVLNNGTGNAYSSVNITGTGDVVTTTNGGFELANSSAASLTTTLTLQGGTLETSRINKNGAASVGVLNFNGGTLKATGVDPTALIRANVPTYVQSGGAEIDTAGLTPTVAAPLLAPSGNGVTGISLIGTTTGYSGAPVVEITGGGGSGAAAVATFDPTSGTITGITVTSPGSGYTSTPTVTLAGGGASTAGASATIGAVSSGGLTKIGIGTLALSGASTYTGNTTISNGTLVLVTGGSLASTNINVTSGAKFDVSAISYTLGSQALSGNGVVTGAVTSASLASSLAPGGAGAVGTLSFSNNLNLSAGAAPVFDLSTSHSSGNDQILVAGTLAMNGNDVIHVNALSGSANLDQTGDYVLFTAGALTMAGQPLLTFDGTAPANSTHYSVHANGNNVVLHYSASAAPVIVSVVVTNTTTGTATVVCGQPVTVYVTVNPGNGTITNVSANLTSLGGPASQTLTALGGNNYSYTFAVGAGATLGSDQVPVTATDTTPSSGSGFGTLTVNASAEVWDGNGANDNWSTGANWVSTYPPGYVGDSVLFSGSTRLTPNMDGNYNVTGLTFDDSLGTAGNFVIGTANGSTLTLSGGITNNSGSGSETLNVPIVLNGTQVILDANGNGITLGGSVSGAGGLTIGTSGYGYSVLTLSGTNSYTGDTIVPQFGTVKLGGSAAIPSGSGKGNVILNTGILDLNGTNGNINGLGGNSTGTVDNSGGNAVTLFIGYGASSSFPGIIQNSSGALTLAKVGTNTLTLSNGSSTYSGGTTASSGQLTLGASSSGSGASVSSGPLGTGTVSLSGGTLQLNAQTLGNNLSVTTGTASILDNNGNNSTLSGNVSGSGTVTIQNSSGNNLSDFLSGDWSGFTGTLNYTTGSHIVNVFTSGSLFNLSQATLNITNASLNNNSSFRPAASETLRLGALSGPSGYFDGDVSSVIEIGNLNTSSTFGGAIMAGSGVTKVGTGTLTFSGANSYTGPTIVSNGTLVVSTLSTGGGSYFVVDGTTLGLSVINNGSLSISNLNLGSSIGCTNTFMGLSSMVKPAITNSGALTLAGTVTVNVTGYLMVGQYPLIGSASIAGTGGFVTGSLPDGAVGNIATNGNTIVLNVTTGSRPYEWTGLNNGNWDTATANWATNGVSTLYSDGVGVQFDDSSTRTNVTVVAPVSPAAITVSNTVESYVIGGQAIAGSTSLAKNGTNTLTLTATNTFTGAIAISAGTVTIGGAGQLGSGNYSGSITNSGVLNCGSTANQTLSGVISGTGSLVQSGTGSLKLFTANTYTGNTILSGGTLIVGGPANAALGAGGTLVLNGGTLTSDNDGTANYDPTIHNNITAGGGSIVGGAGTALHVAGNISGSAALGLAGLLGQSGLRLEGDDSGYTGTVTVTNDNTRLGSATAGSAAAAWVLTGNLQLDVVGGGTFNLGSLSGNGAISGHANNSSTAISTLSVGALNTSTVYGGVIFNNTGYDGAQNNVLALTKAGTGTLTLTGTNTYTGQTTVSNGTLLVNGAISTGPVAVNGGTLGGSGTIGGAVTVNSGGTLAPGGAFNTMTVSGNIILNTGSTNSFEVNGSTSTNDAIVLGGSVTYGGVLKIVPTGTFTSGQTFTLFSGAGAASASNFAGIIGAPNGLTLSFTNGVLSVLAGPSGSNQLTNSVTGGGSTLSLSWGSGWTLQRQTNGLSAGLGTNWQTYVAGNSGITSTNISIDTTNGTVFYRLTYP